MLKKIKLLRLINRKLRTAVVFSEIMIMVLRSRILGRDRKCIFFISTPTHGNLGDQAIVYAQYQMMNKLGYGENVVEITRPEYERVRKVLPLLIRRKDIILIDGGGNIGTLWPEEENKMRDIIERFPNNSIYIFPQTAFFSDDENGKTELARSIEIYSKHDKLTVFCRDIDTYNLFQKRFAKVKSYYTPDMVLYLTNVIEQSNFKKDILLCIRKDKEAIDANIENEIKDCLKGQADKVREVSTVIERCVWRKTRKSELMEKWEEIGAAKLVITDRLHCMIFCAITGTQCIALDNISHKVRNGYEWLKQLSYIDFCDDIKKLEELIQQRMQTDKVYSYDKKQLEPYYDMMEEMIRREFT